jgi:hypothetical protein
MVPSKDTWSVMNVTCRLSAAASISAASCSGMNRTRAWSMSRISCDGVRRLAHHGGLLVHEPSRLDRERDGALRDHPGPPRRHLALMIPAHSLRQPVTELDDVGEVGPDRVTRHPQPRGDLGDAELIDHRRPLTSQRLRGLETRRRVTGVSGRVQRHPMGSELHRPNFRGPPGVLLGPQRRQHPAGESGKVTVVAVAVMTKSKQDHRQLSPETASIPAL